MALILIIGLEVWRCVLFAGLFVWAVEQGEGVVLLRFLWCWLRVFFLNRFISRSGVWWFRKVSDVFGIVLWCQKGQGWTTRTEILCFLFGSHMVACSWLGGCLLWGNRLKSGVDGRTVIELKFFYELGAVI